MPALNPLIAQHFVKTDPKPGKGKRWFYCCWTYNLEIEHRDLYLLEHLANASQCPDTDPNVCNKASHHLMQKGGISVDSHTISPEVVDSFKTRKCKLEDAIAGWVDIPLNNNLKKKANEYLLWCMLSSISFSHNLLPVPLEFRYFVHSNTAWHNVDDPFLYSFTNTIHPSYSLPGHSVLLGTILTAESIRIHGVEVKRLKSSNCNTLLIDGWEDKMRQSLTGIISARVNEPPVVLGLCDITEKKGTSAAYLKSALSCLSNMEVSEATNFLALITDNPTVMQSFRKKFELNFP
jgi:hypothetical protein